MPRQFNSERTKKDGEQVFNSEQTKKKGERELNSEQTWKGERGVHKPQPLQTHAQPHQPTSNAGSVPQPKQKQNQQQLHPPPPGFASATKTPCAHSRLDTQHRTASTRLSLSPPHLRPLSLSPPISNPLSSSTDGPQAPALSASALQIASTAISTCSTCAEDLQTRGSTSNRRRLV